jgi:hypothetical protein
VWNYANAHEFMFFALAVIAMLVVRSIFVNFARALTAWGTKHCGTCACHQETGDDDHSEEEES